MSIERYWLKTDNILVGEIYYDVEEDLFSMDILNPYNFFGRMDKLFFTDKAFRAWVESRLTPEYQGEYDVFLHSCGLTGNEDNVRWKLFLATRGANVKDHMWLAFREDETYEEGSPWYKISNPQLFPNALEEVPPEEVLTHYDKEGNEIVDKNLLKENADD